MSGVAARNARWRGGAAAATAAIRIRLRLCIPSRKLLSKWNKIEHRLFSEITKNWRSRPLESYQVVVNLIGATTTETGLRVRADLDAEYYPTKVKVTDKELATVDLHPHSFHGEWNYAIKHQTPQV